MAEFRVRDQRRPGHHWADNEILDEYAPKIGAYGYAIYMFLARFAGNDNGRCSKSHAEIARTFGLSADTVQRSISCLEDHGLIETEVTPGKPCTFYLMEVQKRPTANSGNSGKQPTAHSGTNLPLTAVPLPLTAVPNKEVILLQYLNTNTKTPLPPLEPENHKPMGVEPSPSAKEQEPLDLTIQDAQRATIELLGVSGYTAMAARDAVGSVKRRKPDLRYIDIPNFIQMLWRAVSTQPKRAIPSLKTFLSEIGSYIDSDHWKAPQKPAFVPQIDWQGGHVGEDGVYVSKSGQRVPGFICPPKPTYSDIG